MQQRTISNRSVAAMTVERDTVFWDRIVPGFGVRVYPTGGKVYIAQARGPEGPKRVTVGRHGVLNADEARQRAALIVTRIKAGEDPVPLPLAARAKGGPTVADLATRYLEDHVDVRLEPRTRTKLRGVLRRHILPALGRLPVEAVERRQVVELHRGLSDRPVAANRAVKTLAHMYRLGEGWGLVPAGCNPCRSIGKYPERGRERFLTDAEFTRLGRALDEAVDTGTVPPLPAAAIPAADADRLPQGARSSRCAGPMSISTPASSTSRKRSPARARCSWRRRRCGCWRTCPAGPAAPGCFRAGTGTGAAAPAASTRPGRPLGRPRSWRMSGSTTFVTPSRPVRWRSVRPCR